MTALAESFDVAIVGGGDVGTALARELAAFELRLVLIEARRDIGAGTSKANTAIMHTGFDAKHGTTEARLVARGHRLLSAYASEVGIPVEPTSAIVVAWTDEQLGQLPTIAANAKANGYDPIRSLSVTEIYEREPNLGSGALGGLIVPDEHIVCPFTPLLACATQAVMAGAELRLDEAVIGLRRARGEWEITTNRSRLSARWVVNAAGLHADEIQRLVGHDGFTVTPRRGELIVFDKLARSLINNVILPVPTGTTKGVLVAPTVFGNVMVGPTAVDVQDKTDTGTTHDGLAGLREQVARIMPRLIDHEVTATYTGLRAATEHADYQIGIDAADGYAWAGGIRSTGLTAALAIAEHMRDRLGAEGLVLAPRPEGLPRLRMPNIGEASLRPYADPERIRRDPAYGEIVCFCERVTAGEIRDAVHSVIPPCDLDGLRRRTRTLMGRCQGFFCGAHVPQVLAEHLGVEVADLTGRTQ
jgi:glycerol-3-phosphate dehydrogenase